MLHLPGFPLHPLPKSWCKARARFCLPTEGGGPPLFSPNPPSETTPSQSCPEAGASCPRGWTAQEFCAALLCILHPARAFLQHIEKVSISLLTLDLGSRTEGHDALASLPQRWAGDAGPGAHLGFPLAVEGVGSSCWTWQCCFGNCSHSSQGVGIQVNPPAHEPHLSLQWCEKVQPKLQPSSPSCCILLSVSFWPLDPTKKPTWLIQNELSGLGILAQHSTNRGSDANLYFGCLPSQIYMNGANSVPKKKLKLSFFPLQCPLHSLFLFIKTRVTQAFT